MTSANKLNLSHCEQPENEIDGKFCKITDPLKAWKMQLAWLIRLSEFSLFPLFDSLYIWLIYEQSDIFF